MTTYRERTKPWYGTRRWQAIRRQQLTDEPLCRMCKAEGKVTHATIADHIEPHKGDEGKFWHGELQSLCKRHHDSDKAIIEAGGTIRRIGPDGWPID